MRPRDDEHDVWVDDFDGPSGTPPSARFWTPEVGGGGWGDGQLQRYTGDPANAALDGRGRLVIRALREPAATGGDAEITSARLTTKAKVAARHGRFEARIKVPAGRGVWPAFWLVGEDIDAIGWPACGEIDVMEVVGSEPRTVHGTIHGPGHAGLGRGIARTLTAPHDLSRAFHDFAVDWTPECVTWLLDGRPYGTVRRDDVPVGTWVLDREVHVIVNLAIGGDWPGNHPDGLALPVTMLVEHVRIASPRLRAG